MKKLIAAALALAFMAVVTGCNITGGPDSYDGPDGVCPNGDCEGGN